MPFREQFKSSRGATTIEFAICLPAVIFFIVLLLGFTYVCGAQTLCTQITNNVLREAIMQKDSSAAREQFQKITIQTVGEDKTEQLSNVQVDVNYSGEYVEVKTTIQIDNVMIKPFVQEVKFNAVGRVER